MRLITWRDLERIGPLVDHERRGGVTELMKREGSILGCESRSQSGRRATYSRLG
jgi:hypothetical protein